MKIRLLISISIIVFLSGCFSFKNPYSKFKVGKIDEDISTNSKATILVGDPQVISRGTLIKDRLRESNHLDNMIDKSIEEKFTPQIHRDIAVISSFAAQLGISFNPSVGDEFKRKEELQSLRDEIETLKLQNRLDTIKSQIKLEQITKLLEPKSLDVDPGTTVDGLSEPDTTSIKTQLEAVIASIDSTLEKINNENTFKGARKSEINQSPEDHFEDLNAYRARLRQRQTEVQLDDVHDAYGNTLYRLQFSATTLPGKTKDKYGVLDFEIQANIATEDELQDLYNEWLVSLNKRNQDQLSLEKKDFDWLSKIALIDYNGMASINSLDLLENGKPIYLAPTQAGLKRDKLDNNSIKVLKSLSAINILNNGNSNIRTLIEKQSELDIQMELNTTYIASLNKKVRNTNFPNNFKNKVTDEYCEIKYDDKVINLFPLNKDDCKIQSNKFVKTKNSKFCKIEHKLIQFSEDLNNVIDCTLDKISLNPVLVWSGESFSYQAQPSMKVQRISSLSSAANSMQVAMSLAATIPQSGIGVKAGMEASKNAVGKIDSLERSPLIVGYTNRETMPHFGYVFGPKAILNSEEQTLEYTQIPATHSVYADISVPVWWKSLNLTAKKMWLGNWDLSNIPQVAKTQNINVRLRPDTNAFDALTNYLAGSDFSWVSKDKPIIESIYPNQVSTCKNNNIEFLIKGNNLWRNPVAYLRGVKHSGEINILPDMNGIIVKFDLSKLPQKIDKDYKDKIFVWTNFGESSSQIEILDMQNGKPCNTQSSNPLGSMKHNLTRFINDDVNNNANTVSKKLRIKLDNPPSDNVQDVKIVARIFNIHGELIQIDLSSNITTISTSAQIYETELILNPKETKSELDGAILNVGLSYKTSLSSERFERYIGDPIIYYPNQESANFKISAVNDSKTFNIKKINGTKVTVNPPSRLIGAYPDLVTKSDMFDVSVTGLPNIDIKVNATAVFDKVTKVVTLTLQDTSIQSERDKICDKPVVLSIVPKSIYKSFTPDGVEKVINLTLKCNT